MPSDRSSEQPILSQKLGSARTWHAYALVLAQCLILYGIVRSFPHLTPGSKWTIVVVGFGVMLGLNAFLLRTSITLFRDRLVITAPSQFGRKRVLRLSDIERISFSPEHDPTLEIRLMNGKALTVGPWSNWRVHRRARLLATFVDRVSSLLPGPHEHP